MSPSNEATPTHSLHPQTNLQIASILAAMIIICFAVIVLTGHVTNSLKLIRFPFSPIGMNPMVAMNFLLIGIAMAIYITGRSRGAATLLRVIAVLLIIQGMGRLIEWIGVYDPKLDTLLFPSRFEATPEGNIPGR